MPSSSSLDVSSSGNSKRNNSEKTRVGNREVLLSASSIIKRTRGRPRLTEDEKERRKELREMGLLKRSKRRSKEGKSILL